MVDASRVSLRGASPWTRDVTVADAAPVITVMLRCAAHRPGHATLPRPTPHLCAHRRDAQRNIRRCCLCVLIASSAQPRAPRPLLCQEVTHSGGATWTRSTPHPCPDRTTHTATTRPRCKAQCSLGPRVSCSVARHAVLDARRGRGRHHTCVYDEMTRTATRRARIRLQQQVVSVALTAPRPDRPTRAAAHQLQRRTSAA